MRKGIYAIYDNKAQSILGILWMVSHIAVAIRTFTDYARAENSNIPKYPQDYDLIQLGTLSEDEKTVISTPPADQIVMTGEALIAAISANGRPATHEQLSLSN